MLEIQDDIVMWNHGPQLIKEQSARRWNRSYKRTLTLFFRRIVEEQNQRKKERTNRNYQTQVAHKLEEGIKEELRARVGVSLFLIFQISKVESIWFLWFQMKNRGIWEIWET